MSVEKLQTSNEKDRLAEHVQKALIDSIEGLLTLANDYAQSVGVESGLALVQHGPKNDIFEVYDSITEVEGAEAVAMVRGAIAHELRLRKNKRAGGCLMIGDEA